MAVSVSGTCDGCAAGRDASLVQLGVLLDKWDVLVALAGNPNTGKSTVFNALTGLRQHTGNWPGKTVARAEGSYRHAGKRVKLIDLPGTYSLNAGSADEEVARDFILFGRPDVTVVVVDATRLERNLNLTIQILEITDRVVICLNLTDEAKRHGIGIDAVNLAQLLGVPVVPTVARRGDGIPGLVDAIDGIAVGDIKHTPYRINRYSPDLEVAVQRLSQGIETVFPGLPNSRWVALRLLAGDGSITTAVRTGEIGILRENGMQHLGSNTTAPSAVSDRSQSDELVALAEELRWTLRPDFQDSLTQSSYAAAQRIAQESTLRGLRRTGLDLDRSLDRLLTSRWLGFPAMLVVLSAVFWLTVVGANIPSGAIAALLLHMGHPALNDLGAGIGMPWWLSGILIDGAYLATAWVVAVMLPPMAIFFPLFTLLEDFGYLPRVAFNLDKLFQKAGAHGKQALTMCMGFGCNAAGVVSARVIDSPRERLIAIITNNFSLCNGRWPTQILIASIFIGALAPAHIAGLASAAAVVGVVVIGIGAMLLVSWALSRTVLRGEATTFSLELPPYRPPRILRTLYTSLIDRTLIVLWRAIVFAAPAGAVIWLLANLHVGALTIAELLISWLDPFGLLLGLNGVILLAYVVAIPANEIVIPTVLMLTVLTLKLGGVGAGSGVMFELESASATSDLLRAGGWTLLTGINVMLFSLLHNPCSTTLYTIYRETRSAKWTTLSAALPLLMGFTVCFLVAQIWRIAEGW